MCNTTKHPASGSIVSSKTPRAWLKHMYLVSCPLKAVQTAKKEKEKTFAAQAWEINQHFKGLSKHEDNCSQSRALGRDCSSVAEHLLCRQKASIPLSKRISTSPAGENLCLIGCRASVNENRLGVDGPIIALSGRDYRSVQWWLVQGARQGAQW